MHRKKFFLISVLVLSGWLLSSARADWLVDTGPGPSSGPNYLLNSQQWGYAAKFTLSRQCDLYLVFGWMEVTVPCAEAEVVIYNNDGAGPFGKSAPGTKRFSGKFYMDNLYPARWAGALTYLSPWRLPAGTYWVAFEVKEPSQFEARLYYPALNPLSEYAMSVGDHYEPAVGLNLGIRINGIPVLEKLTGARYLLLD
jgi:hypothetical protein